ncbi:hypothetical protein [Flammeovirga aprica]|uniref:Uncharacterized protein n=1 Tax=Flammeovirga aprica JL-4 TaxID=694437 RepID=A0A7X9S1P5_9BACT|nr:hypothetical protein [Flammeovirga aprica]NME72666.1 hypothetical protein [Flammeovirga aprica JL-4]
MSTTIIALFIANATAHIISFQKLKKVEAPNSTGVLAFVFINALIVLLLWQSFVWAKWPALLFPVLGGFGLFLTTIIKEKGTWIDYVIFLLDIIIISLVLDYYFL